MNPGFVGNHDPNHIPAPTIGGQGRSQPLLLNKARKLKGTENTLTEK